MKRAGDLLSPEDLKRVRSHTQHLPEGATILIQQENGEYATLVHRGGELGLAEAGEEGHVTVSVAEDGTVEQQTMDDMTDTTEEIVHGAGEELVYEQSPIIDEEQETEEQVEHLTIEQLKDGETVEQIEHVTMPDDTEQQWTIEQIEDADEAQTVQQVTLAEDEAELNEDDEAFQNIIIQHMDISEPLSKLRKLLEARLQCTLHNHEFWLQDTIPLEPSKNLVSQCVQGSGMVQINVEVKSHPGMKPRLNIVDILKPAEEVIEMTTESGGETLSVSAEELQQAASQGTSQSTQSPSQGARGTSQGGSGMTKVVIPFPEESDNVTRWIVDQAFRKEQERLKIPFDPAQWNPAHVRHWIQWAIKEFSLQGVSLNNFQLSGKQLCELQHEQFTRYIPHDKGDIFWTHLELLRKCKFVAVIQQPTPHAITTITVSTSDPYGNRKGFSRRPRAITIPSDRIHPGNRTGNNGQIQLWQFLLELLTDKDFREIIHWVGEEGEFKLHNPELVAQLWGQRKNKPTMNYEKLSRALRYYYDGDMIAKVHGKRFVYKFVCDLRMLLGYTAAELSRLVNETAARSKGAKLSHSSVSLGGVTPTPISTVANLNIISSTSTSAILKNIIQVQPHGQ